MSQPNATFALPAHVADFLADPNRFATLATTDPDGAPRQAVIWFTFEADGRITINSREGRRWPANLRRDPRCSLTIADAADQYRFVGLTGRVVDVIDDQEIARADIVAMARCHYPEEADAGEAFLTQQRVSFRVEITACHDHLSD